MLDGKKKQFIDVLASEQTRGIIREACRQVGISRQTYYDWKADDEEFAKAAEVAMDEQGDIVESRLLDLIEAGDTSATIFYCKTKLKNRGYTERVVEKKKPEPEPEPKPKVEAITDIDIAEMFPAKNFAKLIKAKKQYIVKLLKKQGKYSEELSMQVKIVAQLLVKTDVLAEEVFGDGHQSMLQQTSREGDKRAIVNPTEKLYLDYAQQSQRALRALGMNTDAKERKSDNDGFNDFMKEFSND
jgi:hypothetical protein